jgi:hypothetical protein
MLCAKASTHGSVKQDQAVHDYLLARVSGYILDLIWLIENALQRHQRNHRPGKDFCGETAQIFRKQPVWVHLSGSGLLICREPLRNLPFQ